MASRFKKVSRIGRGTFGEAWLVTSTCSGRRYVIKEVQVDEMSEEELEKTRTEATILARCKHSSIIRYKEYFMLQDPATMCLVMEYADGGDLAEKVKAAKRKGEALTENTILHWFIQVIFAVQYLHANNILHRDLKTQNIFLTKTNLVKVGDFGIARFLRDKQDLATTAIGTPYYLSPEICQRRPYNHKSDMWAVGCILYELCALRHPFDAENFEDLVVKILRGAYRPLPGSFSSLIKDLISVMLRTNPERRPTADALLMLPALKPYVENYLQQYEELLNNKMKVPSTSDGKVHDTRSPNSKDVCSDVELDEKIKVLELDKPNALRKLNVVQENVRLPEKEEDCSDSHNQEVESSLSRETLLGNQPCILPGDYFYPPKDLKSVSSQEDASLSTPKTPAVCETPSYRIRENSPVHPPAPPNTPVDGGKFLSTPPNIPLMTIFALCSDSPCSASLRASPVYTTSCNDDNIWKGADEAPTPYNTAEESPFDSPPNKERELKSPCYNANKAIAGLCELDHMIVASSIVRSPRSDSVYNKGYSCKSFRSQGRVLGETFIVDKNIWDSVDDDVFATESGQ
ncbi:uncharacterized protein LOC135210212 isoform X2 [Macrobrachium nipponense]